MKLRSLHIENFRGVKRFSLTAESPSVFLTGPNGAGKTSILDAIRMLLFGRCFDQSGQRIENGDLVRRGEKKSKLIGVFEHGGATFELRMEITPRAQSLDMLYNDKPVSTSTAKALRQQFWTLTGINPHHAECSANPRYYLLGGALCESVLPTLSGDTASIADQVYALSGDRAAWLRQFCASVNLSPDSVQVLGVIGSHAFNTRTQTKKLLVEAKTEADRLGTNAPAPTQSSEALRSEHNTLTARLRDLYTLRGKAGAAGRSLDTITRDREAAEAARDAAKSKVDAIKPALEAVEADITACESAISQLLDEDSHIRGNMTSAQTTLRALMEKAKHLSSVCPTCGQSLPAESQAELTAALEEQITAAQLVITGETNRQKANEISLAAPRAALVEHKALRVRGQTALGTAQSALQAAEQKLAILMAERPAEAIDLVAVEAEIQASESRQNAVKQALEQLAVVDRRASLEATAKRHEAEIENLDWAVKAFRDNELTAQLASGGISEFLNAVNGSLSGLVLSIDATEKSPRLLCNGYPIECVSDGELVLLQLAVAQAFGHGGIAMIDGLDGLDGRNKGVVFEAVEGLLDRVGTLILAGSWGIGDAPESWESVVEAFAPTQAVWVA